MSERLVVTAFIEGNDGKKRPQRIGTIVMKSASEGSFYMTAMPIGKWDGSAKIEPPRDDQQPRLSQARDARPYGTSGHGASAKHAVDRDDSDLPFASQEDTIGRWMR